VEEVRLDLDGPVATITVDRPERRNAVSLEVIEQLDAALGRAAAEAGAIVLRGGGERVFLSGGDLKDFAALRTQAAAAAMARRMRRVLDRIATLEVPVLAALNGDAYGGGAEVAVACDLRIAADDVRVGFVHGDLGILPAWGGVERLCALVGRGRALELLLTRRVLAGEELASFGLVERVVPRAAFEDAVTALAASLAALAPAARRGIKRLVEAAAPAARPLLEERAVDAFAAAWVADDHWRAAEAAERRRRARHATGGAASA